MTDEPHHPQHHVVSEHAVGGFMARVSAVLDGAEQPAPVRTVTRAPRSIADATDEWVAQRAMAEQVVSEANAVAGASVLDLVDEVGRAGLTFVVRGPGGSLRVTMTAAEGLAWLACEGQLAGRGAGVALETGVELAAPVVLEEVALALLRPG